MTGTSELRRWLGRGGWAMTEQALFAITNFAINLILARFLLPESYGAFGFALATIFLFGSAQDAFLSESILVLGSGKYKAELVPYVSTVLGWHWCLSALSSAAFALLGMGAALIGSEAIATAYLASAAATPGIFYMALARGACYLRERPELAAFGGVTNLFTALAGLAALAQLDRLGVTSALVLMGAAGLLAGACMFRGLGVPPLGSRSCLGGAPVLRDHWRYGRWVLVSAGANWAIGNIYYVILPAFAGLAAGGALLAMSLFIRPVVTMLTPVGLVLVPPLVRARARPEFGRCLRLALTGLLTVAAAYWLVLALWHETLVERAFAGRYEAVAHVLAILGFLPLCLSAVRVFASALRAMGRPDLEARAYLVSTIATLTVGLVLVLGLGLEGAAIGLLVSSGTLAVAMALKLRGAFAQATERS